VDILELPYTDTKKSLLVVLPTNGDSTDLVSRVRRIQISDIRNDGVHATLRKLSSVKHSDSATLKNVSEK
jgi:hypothetical protein